jgi:SNF2 family DNA or RNA helicase
VTSRLSLADDHLVLDFPYDANQVTEIKTIQGAKWDKVARVWRVPISSIERVRHFATNHQFSIDPEVMLFYVPRPLNESKGISKKGEWLYLSFSYDPVKVRAAKSVPGITWDTKTKSWRVPLTSISQAIAFGEMFGLEIPEDIIAEAHLIKTVREETITASKAKDAELEIPTLNGKLLPYQKAGIKYATNARRCFIADDMGLGKTIQAIGTLEHSAAAYPAVIVCPSGLVLNWRDEYHKWLPHRKVAVVTNRSQFPEEGTFDVLVIGYPNISHWNKLLLGYNGYVFDESHYAKSPTAQRTKAAIKMARSAPDTGVVLCLTGTPITNRPAEYASQLDILGQLNRFGGMWGFYRRYCGAFRDRFGQWHIEGASNLDELNETLRSICYIRRTKDQVLDELPPVRHSRLVVSGTSTGMKEYNEAQADIVAYIVARAEEIARELGKSPRSAAVQAKIKAESNEHLMRISVLRKLAAKAKMEAVYEWIDQKIGAGEKVVVAAHHREVVDAIANHYCGLKIQGGMNVEDIQEAKLKFQTGTIDEAPIISLSIQAAKTGHTLTAAQEVLFVELPWSPADVDQTYSRCHRLGQKGSVMSTYILASGTIDEEIYDLIASKRAVVDAATEGTTLGEDVRGAEQIVMNFLKSGLAESD